MKQRLFTFILLFFAANSFAQQREFIFKNYTQEEGLPSNETYFIFEDSRHYLWVATDLGVVRYNGNKFELFNLPDNVVFRISEDSKGRIWFFTHKAQLAYFENEKMNLYKYNDAIARRVQKINITDELIDSSGNIQLNSSLDSNFTIKSNGKINASRHVFSDTVKTLFSINLLENNSCFTQRIRSSYYDSDSISLIVRKGAHLITYDIPTAHKAFAHSGSITLNGKDVYFFGGKMLIKLNEDGSYIIKKMPKEILCLNKSINGNNLWVGMNTGGAILFDLYLNQASPDTILPDKSITSITLDYEGGLWFSSLENGIYYIKSTSVNHLRLHQNNTPLVSRMMNVNDRELIYSNSSGLYKLVNNKSIHIMPLENLITNDLFPMQNKIYII